MALKYKVGDKVRIKSLDWYNENKDNYGSIYADNGFCFWKSMARLCGEIMKITSVKVDPEDSNKGYYFMENSEEKWTDEMIEGLVEDTITTNEQLFEPSNISLEKEMEWNLPEGYQFVDENGNVINATKIVLEKRSSKTDDIIKWLRECDMTKYIDVLYSGMCSITFDTEKLIKDITEMIETNNMKRNACQKCVFAVDDDKPHCGLRGFRSDFNVERCSAENNTVPNGYELQEDGYFSWVEKTKEYPKTYEECLNILGYNIAHTIPMNHGHNGLLIMKLQRLLIYRDAYWKIAGEEMGLDGPWEPDWKNDEQFKYIITCRRGCIIKDTYTAKDVILAFPTAEMRDAFYENFKKEIESCKELL